MNNMRMFEIVEHAKAVGLELHVSLYQNKIGSDKLILIESFTENKDIPKGIEIIKIKNGNQISRAYMRQKDDGTWIDQHGLVGLSPIDFLKKTDSHLNLLEKKIF